MAISDCLKVLSYRLLFKETPFSELTTITDDSDFDTETETETLLDEEAGLYTPTSHESQRERREKKQRNNLSKRLLPRLDCGCGWVPELFCVLFLSLVLFMGTLIFFALTVNVAQYIELCESPGHGRSQSYDIVPGSGSYGHKREEPTTVTGTSVSAGADVPIITMKAYRRVIDWSPDGVLIVSRTLDYTSTLSGKSRSTTAPTPAPTSTGVDGPAKAKSPELIDRFWNEMLGV